MLCKSQLLDAVHVWNQSMENRKSVDVLFLDISKALDKVLHAYLMEKLKVVGIDGSLLSWIRDYLTNRRQIKVHRWRMCFWMASCNFWCSSRGLFLVHYFSSFTSMTLQIISLLRWLFCWWLHVSCLGRCKRQLELQNDLTKLITWSNISTQRNVRSWRLLGRVKL